MAKDPRDIEIQRCVLENQAVLRILCHDMANPLAIIMTAGAIAQNSTDLEEVRSCMEKIRRAADEQRSILRRLREAREALSGNGLLELEETNLNDLLARMRFLFEEELKRKKISLEVKLASDAQEVFADEVLFPNLVLKTLISNAIKFSHAGNKIQVTSRRNEHDVVLTVCDSGIGIPQEMIPHLFGLNYREIRPGTAGERGQGLGLALLAVYMKRIGGEARIESPVGQTGRGTAVHVSIPSAT